MNRAEYEERVYRPLLALGKTFERFATDIIREKLAFDVHVYGSREQQYAIGESAEGFEFKRDGKFRQYGTLWIETAEKANPVNSVYAVSGIYRNNNTRYWVQGDEQTFWMFPLARLREAVKGCQAKTTPTSKGWLLPLETADRVQMWKYVAVAPAEQTAEEWVAHYRAAAARFGAT